MKNLWDSWRQWFTCLSERCALDRDTRGHGWHWVVHVWSGPHSQTLLRCWRGRTFCCVAENSEHADAKTTTSWHRHVHWHVGCSSVNMWGITTVFVSILWKLIKENWSIWRKKYRTKSLVFSKAIQWKSTGSLLHKPPSGAKSHSNQSSFQGDIGENV